MVAIIGLVVLFLLWKPKSTFEMEGVTKVAPPKKHPLGEVLLAWSPYLLLVAVVFIWGQEGVKKVLDQYTVEIAWPGLHNLVERIPPVVGKAAPYAAIYKLSWLSAAGTACLIASVLAALVLKVGPGEYFRILMVARKQLFLGLAFLMNYCGATVTLGLAFAATGVLFPFFSALLGWLGVFLTGSDTSANALFGNLQVVTATKLGLNPILMAASNSAGGVMGKMISLQSIAVAAAATGMPSSDEAKLFRFTLKHSVLLASLIGLVTTFYAYVAPGWVK
jgi:lactate permease